MRGIDKIILVICMIFLLMPALRFLDGEPVTVDAREPPEVVTVYRGVITRTMRSASWFSWGYDTRWCAVQWLSPTISTTTVLTHYQPVPLCGGSLCVQSLSTSVITKSVNCTYFELTNCYTLPVVIFNFWTLTGTITATLTCWGAEM